MTAFNHNNNNNIISNGVSHSNLILNMTNDLPSNGNNKGGSTEYILTDGDDYDENDDRKEKCSLKTLGLWCKIKGKNIFRKKVLYKRLPVLTWLPKYTSEDGIGDLVAGITVGLTVIPQALAYSGIAGLPPAYGLYGSFLGCIVYILFGSCKDVPMGPTAIQSILTYQAAAGVWQRAVLLTFFAGCIELAMGLFGLGFLLDFVSGPVSSGFTSAVALIILTSQVKDLIGIQTVGNTFLEIWISIINNIKGIRLADSILGVVSIVVLLLMRKLTQFKIGPKNDAEKSMCQKICNKMIWLIGTARNALLVVVSGGIAAIFYQSGNTNLFLLIGDIPPGLPNVQLPPFSIDEIRNETSVEIIQYEETFSEMVSHMGSALIVVPLIALLENMSVCKAFASTKAIDATQELIAIGTSNIVNSFVQAFPVSGALARGAVNNASGVRTPLGGLYTALLVIVSLLFLTPLFFYIPKSALAALIIAAVIFTVEVKVIKPMWRSKKIDLIPGLAAFIACLVLPLEFGILVGIGINVVFILYHAARPKIHVEFLSVNDDVNYLMITPDRCLIFPSVEYVRKLINKKGLLSPNVPVVIDCSHIYGADFTAAKVVQSLIKDFNVRDQLLIFYNLKSRIVHIFEGIDSSKLNLVYNLETLEQMILENK